jgi:hypothetical protein
MPKHGLIPAPASTVAFPATESSDNEHRYQAKERVVMEHQGGCHCNNLRLHMRLTKPPAENLVRSCACSFCRAHATRTVSDPDGQVVVQASDWSLVGRYQFGSRTADYVLCRRCGVYVGAVCETASGLRAVINTHCLRDRAAFTREAARPDYDNETVDQRLARRAANWMPAVMHGLEQVRSAGE